PAGRRAQCFGHARSFSCTALRAELGMAKPQFGDLQTMGPTPDTMSRRFTASSNCRSENRLKMRSPNHAPSRAAGMKASDSPPSRGEMPQAQAPCFDRCWIYPLEKLDFS